MVLGITAVMGGPPPVVFPGGGVLGADRASLFSGLQLQAPCGLQGSLQSGPQPPEQLPSGPGEGVPHDLGWPPYWCLRPPAWR